MHQPLPKSRSVLKTIICDDGMGHGPYQASECTMWRDGEKVVLDFDGTDPQSSPASINFYLNENMFKMFFGIYMIMVFDPHDPVQ